MQASVNRALIALSILSSCLALPTACSKSKKDSGTSVVNTALTIKVRNTESSSPLVDTQTAALTTTTTTGAGNISFTPTSFKLWINTVVLQNDSGLSNQFYQCESSAEDCEVDFGDPSSIAHFEAKLSSLPVGPGTYTKVWLSCSPSSGGYIKFKGQATLGNGSTVYTADADDADGVSVTSDSTKAGTLKINGLNGCGITMPLSKPVVVAEPAAPTTDTTGKEVIPTGTTLTMTVFSNLRLVTFYTPNGSPGMGGCRLSNANVAANTGGPAFCANYPSVFPYFGETTPTVEYYKSAQSKTSSSALTEADSNVLIKVIKDASGTPFWASFNNYYVESTPGYAVGDTGVSGYANAVTAFSVNADSTLTIKSGDYGFDAFQRAAHTGEVKGEGINNGAGTGMAVTYYYKAFPYTP